MSQSCARVHTTALAAASTPSYRSKLWTHLTEANPRDLIVLVRAAMRLRRADRRNIRGNPFFSREAYSKNKRAAENSHRLRDDAASLFNLACRIASQKVVTSTTAFRISAFRRYNGTVAPEIHGGPD